MLETKQQARSPVHLDTGTHLDCLEYVRATISEADRTTAHQIAAVLKDCCQRGYAAAIWSDLTEIEKQQFQELLAPPPLGREFGRRIREAIGYQSPAVAVAIEEDLGRAIDAGNLTAADVVAVVGAAEFAEFQRLRVLMLGHEKT